MSSYEDKLDELRKLLRRIIELATMHGYNEDAETFRALLESINDIKSDVDARVNSNPELLAYFQSRMEQHVGELQQLVNHYEARYGSD